MKGWSSRSNRPPCAFPPGAFCFPASHTFDHFPHTFATSAFDVTPFASCSARSLYVRRRFPIRFLCESIHSIKQARQYTQQHNTTAHQCSPRYNNTHSKVTVISPVPLPAPLLLSPRSPRVLRREGSTPWRQCGIPPGIAVPRGTWCTHWVARGGGSGEGEMCVCVCVCVCVCACVCI